MAGTLLESRPDLDASAGQFSFEELGEPLSEVTFVVLDLETTGGSAAHERITEFGAVKVRGGQVMGEFATLVDPGRAIPVQITVLTGISDAMVFGAPRVEEVLPGFLEFIRGSVLVAHNAGFDIGFLKAACARMHLAWPGNVVLDTVRLARAVLSREEAPSLKLGRLAALLGARTTPDHRALHDARATVDVLHALFERVGGTGVHTLTDVAQLGRSVPVAHRRKLVLADGVPAAPGVYLFKGPSDEVLYVGTSGNLRRRVRSYFGAGETRHRIRQMVGLAERVDHVVCAHALEALVREQRLIAAHRPAYNRRSRTPQKAHWIVLTRETFPRLSVVSTPPRGDCWLGPFPSRARAQIAVDALHEVTGIRRCHQRLGRAPRGTPCALAELGRCGAPCAGRESAPAYGEHVTRVVSLLAGGSDELLVSLRQEVQRCADQGRFDQAAVLRDRLSTLADMVDRAQRLTALAAVAEFVVAAPDGRGGWDLAVIRHGRLAGAGQAARGVDPMPVVDLLRRSAETVLPSAAPLPAASAEEMLTVLRWMEQPGARMVHASDPWRSPIRGAGRWRGFVSSAALARRQFPVWS